MKPAMSIPAVTLVFALLVVAAPAGGDDPPPSVQNDAAVDARELRIDHAIYFRELFGFRADYDFVAELDEGREHYEEAVSKWGTPLSHAELEDLDRRQKVNDAIPVITRYVERAASASFAGLFIDQSAGGTIRIGFTEDRETHQSALRALFPYPGWLDFFQASYSESYLQGLADRVNNDMLELELSSVAVAVEANAVEVGTPNLSDELRLELAQRFPGEPLHLISRPYSETTAHYQDYSRTPPMVGAIRIDERDQFGFRRYSCSAAFNVKASGTGNAFATTAGHCGPPGRVWKHGDLLVDGRYRIGEGTTNPYWGEVATRADAQRIALRNEHLTNRVLSGSVERGISGVELRADVQRGDPVCRSGYASEVQFGEGLLCGTVTNPDVDQIVRDTRQNMLVTVVSQVEANFMSCFGDSGGPVFTGGVAKGIVSNASIQEGSSCGRPTSYTHIDKVEDQLGVKVRTAP